MGDGLIYFQIKRTVAETHGDVFFSLWNHTPLILVEFSELWDLKFVRTSSTISFFLYILNVMQNIYFLKKITNVNTLVGVLILTDKKNL